MRNKEKKVTKAVVIDALGEESINQSETLDAVGNSQQIEANEVTDVLIPDTKPEDIIFHGSTNPDEEKELIKVEEVPEHMPSIVDASDKKFPLMCMANVYAIRDNVNNLSGNNVVHEYLGQLFHRTNQMINQFETNYINTLPIHTKEHKEYNEKIQRILTKYVDKDANGKFIIEGESYKISDPQKQIFCDNSFNALKEEYKDYVKAFEVYKKVMDYIYINHYLSYEDIDYLLTETDPQQESMGYTLKFPNYEEVLIAIS